MPQRITPGSAVDDSGLWMEVGSPLMQHATLAAVRLPSRTCVLIPTHHLHLTPLFALCPAVRPPSSPWTLCAHPTPPALLQAGHSDKTIAGCLAWELVESISSQQTTADISRSQILPLRDRQREPGSVNRLRSCVTTYMWCLMVLNS